jgi:drug/metabolite transporter (DMT)-like permease
LIFLLLRIVFNTCFSQLLKLAQTRDGNILPTAFVNYTVAAIVSGAITFALRSPTPTSATIWLGLLTGLTYAIALLGIETGMKVLGVGITVAISQLSVLVPIAASLIFFREHPNAYQVIGMIFATLALPLLSRSRTVEQATPVKPGEAALAIFLLFFVTGLSGVTMKMLSEYSPDADRMSFTTILFATSAVIIGGVTLIRRIPWGPSAFGIGSMVGLSNVFQLEATLKALAIVPAYIVFPVTSAITVSLNAVLSVLFWHEKLDREARAGILLSILAAIFMNR